MIRAHPSARIRKNQATGVYVLHDTLVVTTATRSGLGAPATETTTVPFDLGKVGLALTELLSAGKLPGRIVCAIEPRHLFSLARPTTRGQRDRGLGAGDLLPARLNSLRGGVVSGFSTVALPAGPHALLVACPRPKAEELLAGLPGRRTSNLRLVSAPMAVAALAESRAPRPKKWSTLLRVVPGVREGLVFLQHGEQPIAWRLIEGGEAGLGASLQAAAVSLQNHAKDDLGLDVIDGALLHIGDDVTNIRARLAETLANPVTPVAELAVDPETASLALALQALRFPREDVDLFRELQPPGDLRQNFPYRATAALWGFVALLGGGVHWEAEQITAEALALEDAATESLERVGLDPNELVDRFEDLRQEVATAEAFIVNRVSWEAVLRELPDLLPLTLQLTELYGDDKVRYPTDQGTGIFDRRLTISGDVDLVEGETNPGEGTEVAEALRDAPTIGRAFGQVNAPNVSTSPDGRGASITVVCQPAETP